MFYFDMDVPASGSRLEQPFTFHATPGTIFNAWLDEKVPPGRTGTSARSLAMSVSSQPTEHKPDKIVFAPVPFESELPFQSGLHFDADKPGNRRFFGFDFMLDPKYEVPLAWVLHLQVWQCCGGHPPFTMQVVPGKERAGPVEFTFGLRDDVSERRLGHPENIVYKMSYSRGEWHRFVFEFVPQSDSSPIQGWISMWLDRKRLFTFGGRWAYDPAQPPFQGHSYRSNMAVEFGIYRQRQPTAQTVYFDGVRYGNSFSEVAFPNSVDGRD